MITNNNEILSIIEREIQKAEKENQELRQQLEAISSPGSEPPPKIADKISFRVGNSRYDRSISTSVDYNTFMSTVKQALPGGTESVSFEIDTRNVIIRSGTDVKLLFVSQAARKEPFVKINAASGPDFTDIMKLNLSGEPPKGPNTISFLFGLPKNDYYIILNFDNSLSYEDGISFFKFINPKQKGIKYFDVDGDQIPITKPEEWAYFIADASEGSRIGKFSTVISE